MAKHRSHRRRHAGKSRTMRRGQMGGELSGNPPSAWGWGLGTVGNGWTQFMNSLTLQPGQNMATAQSNDLVPIKNINAQNPMQGGKRRGKRGGNLASVLTQAAPAAALTGALLYADKRLRKSRRNKK